MSKQSKNSVDLTNATANQPRTEISNELPQAAQDALKEAQVRKKSMALAKELNGPKGPEPTRYGDWESKGRCYDF